MQTKQIVYPSEKIDGGAGWISSHISFETYQELISYLNEKCTNHPHNYTDIRLDHSHFIDWTTNTTFEFVYAPDLYY